MGPHPLKNTYLTFQVLYSNFSPGVTWISKRKSQRTFRTLTVHGKIPTCTKITFFEFRHFIVVFIKTKLSVVVDPNILVNLFLIISQRAPF